MTTTPTAPSTTIHNDVEVSLRIEGMTCASCVARVETALRELPGVSAARVNLATETAAVQLEGDVPAEALVQAVRSAGYEAAPFSRTGADVSTDRRHQQRLREARQAVITAIGFGLPIMGLHWFAHRLSSSEPGAHFWPMALQGLLAILLLASPAGGPILVGGFRAIIHRSPNMDLLISLGVLAATIGSFAGMFLPSLHLNHFHEAAMILGFINVGRYLEVRARGRASAALAALAKRAPRTAVRIEDGSPRQVPVDEVNPGDQLQVAAESYVPVDGRVVSGSAAVDASMWTGESLPVEVGPGDEVLGGSYVHSGAMVVQATAVGARSAMARIIQLVDEAQTSKTHLQRVADRVAGVFVPIVIALAAITAAGWLIWAAEDRISAALSTTVAVLVVACPCAMGLATPTAVMVATGSAAMKGIIVRDAAALERAGSADTVFLDKTGTLTTGQPRVAAVYPQEGVETQTVLTLAAAAEQFSPHPLAKAIVEHARERGLKLPMPSAYRAEAGMGVVATIDGAEVAVGSERHVRAFLEGGSTGDDHTATDKPPPSPALSRGGEVGAGTLVYVVRGASPVGAVVLEDTLRETARETVARLKTIGVHPVLLTGDREAAGRAVGAVVGIDDVEANVSPGGKSERVAARQAAGHRVIMVGDGINDAPALAAADVGIAMGGGTQVAGETAHITLVGDRLELLPESVLLARRSARIIKQNLFWAFIYNIVAIPLAALAILPASYAAAAMMFSSISVVLNSLRLQRIRA
ncbi:MAG: copper-translocating P-type ATPase [Phycisphaerae bacterium]